MKIQPFNQYVIIKFDVGSEFLDPEKRIVAHNNFRLPRKSGQVLAVGRGLVTAGGQIIPMQCQPGDRVWVVDTGKNIFDLDDYDGQKGVKILTDESLILGKILEEDDNLISMDEVLGVGSRPQTELVQ